MTPAAAFAALCAAWWVVAVSIHVYSAGLALAQPALRRRRATRRDHPPVTVLTPVLDAEHFLDAALASAFTQRYPKLRLVLAAAHADAAALPTARAVAARFPQAEARVVIGARTVAASPKVNTLALPLEQAPTALIAIKDSNIAWAPNQLAGLVAELVPGVGLVNAVQIVVAPQGFPAEIERAFINGYQGRLFLAASALGGGFGIGKTMLFRREDFVRAGGVAAISGTVLEDHALSQAMRRIGLKTAIAGAVVRQPTGRRRWRAVWDRQLRWMVCRRVEAPLAYATEPLFGLTAAALAAAGAAPLLSFPPFVAAAATVLGWYAVEAAFLIAKGWGFGPLSPAAWLCRDLLVLPMWLAALRAKSVRWGALDLPIRRAAR